MRRLVFLPLAISDLREITRYSRREFGDRRAREYIETIKAKARDLATGRSSGLPFDDPIQGLWKQRVGSHFLFYHLYDGNFLTVVRILHGRMNIEDHL